MTRKEFKDIFDAHYEPLCNYALKILGDRDTAQDVVQDVMVDFWNKASEGYEIESTENYLVRSVKFKCIDQIRKLVRNQNKEADIKEQEVHRHAQEEDDNLDQQKLKVIYEIMAALPTKTQQVFRMAKMEGMTYNEIAEDLDISPKTVENQMGRALKIIRTKLKEYKFFTILLIFLFF